MIALSQKFMRGFLSWLCFHSVISSLLCACANKQPITPSHHHIFLTTCLLPQLFITGSLGPSTLVSGDSGWGHPYEPDLLLQKSWLLLCVKWKKLKVLKPIPAVKLKLMYKAIWGKSLQICTADTVRST